MNRVRTTMIWLHVLGCFQSTLHVLVVIKMKVLCAQLPIKKQWHSGNNEKRCDGPMCAVTEDGSVTGGPRSGLAPCGERVRCRG